MPHLHHTIVIGAGQAGLAAGYYLKQADRDFMILDAHARVGDNWRERWEGLRLFSPQRYNALPGLPPPGGEWHLPSRLEVADYLEHYAGYFALPLTSHCTCVRAQIVSGSELGGIWELETTQGTFRAQNIIVATGAYRTPWLPGAVADTFPGDVKQYHSSEIRDVADVADAGTAALLIGAGASGQQLSRLLLDRGTKVTLLGPKLGNLPRALLGKDIYWWLYKSGLITLRTDRGPGKWLANEAGDVTVAETCPEGHPNFRRVQNHLVKYAPDGLRFRCEKTTPKPLPWPEAGTTRAIVIWCTGYRNAYPWLPAAMLDENDAPLLEQGRSTVYPEVTFLGLPNLRRTNSSLLGGVGEDARVLVF